MRLFRLIDAEGDAAAINLSPTFPWRQLLIQNDAFNLALVRKDIGRYYEWGRFVPQDYAEAARWYQKSIDTMYCGRKLYPDAAGDLGRLYLYGLGVPQNRSAARDLWVSLGSRSNDIIRLLDNNALPKTITDWNQFDFKQALAKLGNGNQTQTSMTKQRDDEARARKSEADAQSEAEAALQQQRAAHEAAAAAMQRQPASRP